MSQKSKSKLEAATADCQITRNTLAETRAVLTGAVRSLQAELRQQTSAYVGLQEQMADVSRVLDATKNEQKSEQQRLQLLRRP